MPPSLSNTQIDKLGERLRVGIEPTPDDLAALQQLRAEYVEPTENVQSRLRALGVERTTSRVKTDKTIIEKLRRMRTRLSTMQDIGGVRMWREMSLREQDEVVMTIANAFQDSRIDDLRNEPHFGYRAVHVIVREDEFRVEVQVRTGLQQLWAETMEKFADAWGRGLRYGANVTFTDEHGKPLPDDHDPVALLRNSSEMIADHEVGRKGRYYALFDPEREAWLAGAEMIEIPEPHLTELRRINRRMREVIEGLLLQLAEIPATVESTEQ